MAVPTEPVRTPQQVYEQSVATKVVPGVIGRDGAIRPAGPPPIAGPVTAPGAFPGQEVQTPQPPAIDPDSPEGIAAAHRQRVADNPEREQQLIFRNWLLLPFARAREAFRDDPTWQEWQQREADLQAAREDRAAIPPRINTATEAVRKALTARKPTDLRKAEAEKQAAEAEDKSLAERIGVLVELAGQAKAEAEQALRQRLLELREQTIDRYKEEYERLNAEIETFRLQREERMTVANHVLNALYVDPRHRNLMDVSDLGLVDRLAKLPGPKGHADPLAPTGSSSIEPPASGMSQGRPRQWWVRIPNYPRQMIEATDETAAAEKYRESLGIRRRDLVPEVSAAPTPRNGKPAAAASSTNGTNHKARKAKRVK